MNPATSSEPRLRDPTRAIRAHDASNAVQLSARQWIGLAAWSLALLVGAPALWPVLEPTPASPDYRMPYALGNDYGFYDRLTRAAAARGDTLIVGDSVVWGAYVTRTQTLAHALDERGGHPRFANLGLDGAHPAALAGLLEHHASGLRNASVVLAANLLWLSSPRHDLQDSAEFDFNHPDLVPQFAPRIPCYRADIDTRLGRVAARGSPFAAWTRHLQQAYLGSSSLPEWTLEHPYENPVGTFAHGIPPSDNKLRHAPEPWTRQGIAPQDFPWVEPAASFQWTSFRRAADLLKRRGNRVVVMICPFNEHMLTPESRARFARVRACAVTSLRQDGVRVVAAPLLPSEDYADASHPLAEGYRRLADFLLASGALPPDRPSAAVQRADPAERTQRKP